MPFTKIPDPVIPVIPVIPGEPGEPGDPARSEGPSPLPANRRVQGGGPPAPSLQDLLDATEAIERTGREVRDALGRIDSQVQTFVRAGDRFLRLSRHESLAAVLLAALVAAAAAALSSLLTLAVLVPRIGVLGLLRALFRHG